MTYLKPITSSLTLEWMQDINASLDIHEQALIYNIYILARAYTWRFITSKKLLVFYKNQGLPLNTHEMRRDWVE